MSTRGQPSLQLHKVEFVDGVRFEVPRDYDPETLFADGFGIWMGGHLEEIVVQFSARVAQAVQSRALAKAKWVPLDGGGVELHWTVPVTPEVIGWLCGWGAEAEVLSPVVVRDQVAYHFRSALEKYQGKVSNRLEQH